MVSLFRHTKRGLAWLKAGLKLDFQSPTLATCVVLISLAAASVSACDEALAKVYCGQSLYECKVGLTRLRHHLVASDSRGAICQGIFVKSILSLVFVKLFSHYNLFRLEKGYLACSLFSRL